MKLFNMNILVKGNVSILYNKMKHKTEDELLQLIYLCGYEDLDEIFNIYKKINNLKLNLNSEQTKLLNIINKNSIIITSLIEDYKYTSDDLKKSNYVHNSNKNITFIQLNYQNESDLVDFYNNEDLPKSFILNRYNLLRVSIFTNIHKIEFICRLERDDNNLIHFYNFKKEVNDDTYYKNYISNLTTIEKIMGECEMKSLNKLLLELRKIQNQSKNIATFLKDNPTKQFETIKTLLICNYAPDIELAKILFSLIYNKSALLNVQNNAYNIFNQLSWKLQMKLNIKHNTDTQVINTELDYDKKIELMKCDESIKEKAREKYNEFKKDRSNTKAETFLNTLLKIPFGIYHKERIFTKLDEFKDEIKEILSKSKILSDFKDKELNITLINEMINIIKEYNDNNGKNVYANLLEKWDLYNLEKQEYLKKARDNLDKAVYGQEDTKIFIERLLAQWMNGKTKGTVFGLYGPPGVGKTTIAKNGITKCFFNEDDNVSYRPFAFISVGGAQDGSILEGHHYTYQGAIWGKIVDVLIDTKCMNPVILIDELDKISDTHKGQEIINILTHLTDPVQNKLFSDKYFQGINFDLSQAIFVFSYNHSNRINKILKDRITEIKVDGLTTKDKIHITQNYTMTTIQHDIGINIDMSKQNIEYVINNYTFEAGVRKLNEKLYDICRNINLDYIKTNELITINKKYIDKVFQNKRIVMKETIHKEHSIGIINCLYALGGLEIGGIMKLEVVKMIYEKDFKIQLTGNLETVIKESTTCALTVALNLLSPERFKELKDNSYGLHLHYSDASTSKDGPSAGVATTLAIYSLFTNRKIFNNLAITGEINLNGEIKAIGGLQAKLLGAYKAGIKKVIIPKENEIDLNILKKKKVLSECKGMKIVFADHIKDILGEVYYD